MKNVCLIPARGGSKRIPKKNIKEFYGKPLIAWSIECAISSKLFDDVYVSTDNHEIAEVAKSYGATIPFMRPKQLSHDMVLDIEVRNHFIDWLKKSEIKTDYLCYLYATAPFITIETLEGCYNKLKQSDADSILTVTSFPYPILRALKINKDKTLSFNWPEHQNSMSQDLPEYFHDVGQCYFFNLNREIKEGYGKRVGYELPRYLCQDIDTIEDFKMAEKLFALLKKDLK